jgi:hypothetical protein
MIGQTGYIHCYYPSVIYESIPPYNAAFDCLVICSCKPQSNGQFFYPRTRPQENFLQAFPHLRTDYWDATEPTLETITITHILHLCGISHSFFFFAHGMQLCFLSTTTYVLDFPQIDSSHFRTLESFAR